MHKYVQTFEVIRIFENDEDAKQAGFLTAKNERKKFDNQCKFLKLERLDGLIPVEIEIK